MSKWPRKCPEVIPGHTDTAFGHTDRMNIYLDIDGTLIHEDYDRAGQPADGLAAFIRSLRLSPLEGEGGGGPSSSGTHTHSGHSYSVYWLTTHCMDGDPQFARAILKASLPEELHADIDRIKPTAWKDMKTEAIDFSLPFMWLDNDVMADEREVLRRRAVLDRQWLVEVNLEERPDRLREIVREYLH